MPNETQLRNEIMDRIRQLYELRRDAQAFIPGKTKVHYAGRVYDEKEMQAMADSLLDFTLTLGANGDSFVSEFAAMMGMKHGLVVNSGSSANLVAVSALCSPNLPRPIPQGCEVITAALAFPTTLNPIIQNGLVPVFVDVEEGTYNLDASLLEQALSDKTRAIVLAHTLGNPADMETVMEFARAHALYVVEDVCDALDSRLNGRRCGTFGDLSTYSFYAAHHITMGEGGAVLTDSAELYRQALSIRDWGRACFCRTGEETPLGACGKRFSGHFEGLPEGYDHKYVYSNIGYNLKPLDIQCAMGIEQLKKLPQFTLKRREHFTRLYEGLREHGDVFILPRALKGAEPSWFAFPLQVREGAGFTRNDIVRYLEEGNIETRMLFAGNILRHPAYRRISHRISGGLAETERVLQDAFFIGVFPGLTEPMLDYMLERINQFLALYRGKSYKT